MNEVTVVENKDFLFDPKNITKETIKKYLCPMASEQELMMGLQIAKTFNLNPLKREVYFVKYKVDQPMQVLTGYEVYLKRAERSGKYEGMRAWTEGKVEDNTLKACIEVNHAGWAKPLYHEAFYSEYVQYKGDGSINKFWKTKPITMIKKVVISQAFRLAFPDEFDGMPYTSDEVVDQEKISEIPEKLVESPRMPLPPQVNESINTNKTNATEAVLDEKEPMPESKPEEKPVFEGEPVKAITKTQGIALMELSKKNGYTQAEVKEYICKNLGYDKHTELSSLDYPDVLKKFGVKK